MVKFLTYLCHFAKSLTYTNYNVCSEAFWWKVKPVIGIFQSRLFFASTMVTSQLSAPLLVKFITWTFRDQDRDFHMREFCKLCGQLCCEDLFVSPKSQPAPPFICQDGNSDWIAGRPTSMTWHLINYLLDIILCLDTLTLKKKKKYVFKVIIITVTDWKISPLFVNV